MVEITIAAVISAIVFAASTGVLACNVSAYQKRIRELEKRLKTSNRVARQFRWKVERDG